MIKVPMVWDPLWQISFRAGMARQKDFLESQYIWSAVKCISYVYLSDGRDQAFKTQSKMPKKIRFTYIIYSSKAQCKLILEELSFL